MRICTFDLELAESPSSENGGWVAARRGDLGISALVIWDSDTNRPHLYDESTLEAAIDHLEAADLLISYNGAEFDIPVISGCASRWVDCPDHYDILQQIWIALRKREKGWRLGEVCERLLGEKKSNTGAAAPKLVDEERYADLFDYCIQDVWLTRMLYNWIVDKGHVLNAEGTVVDIAGFGTEFA
jgi:hypothetical protein